MYSDISLNSPRKANSCNKHLPNNTCLFLTHFTEPCCPAVGSASPRHSGTQVASIGSMIPRASQSFRPCLIRRRRKRVRGLGEKLGMLGTWKVQVSPPPKVLWPQTPPCGPTYFLGNVVSLESRRKMKGVNLCHMNYKWQFFLSLFLSVVSPQIRQNWVQWQVAPFINYIYGLGQATQTFGVSFFFTLKLSSKWKYSSFSYVWFSAIPWTVAWRAPLSMEFSR